MQGVTILDKSADGFLAVTLEDVLRLLGRRAETSVWKISGVETLENGGKDTLQGMSDSGTPVRGSELLRLASTRPEIIDGTFAGYENDEDEPWIVIRAVDSSAYDVETNDERLLDQVRKRFQNVADIPKDPNDEIPTIHGNM